MYVTRAHMLEIIFAFVLGFGGMAMGCFAVVNQDDSIQSTGIIAIAGLLALAVLAALYNGDFVNPRDMLAYLIGEAGTTHLTFAVTGAGLAVLFVLYLEGTFNWLWRRIHPASAPTDTIRAGQRGQGHMPKPSKMSAALMGTSTRSFAVQGLDVKTTALIKLSLLAFKNDRYTIVTLENSLKLGDGRRYFAFQKLVAEAQYEKDVTDILHPYWRAINGSQSSARLMFTCLCELARDSRNTNKRTVSRLREIGGSLGLVSDDVNAAIGLVRA